MIRYLAPVLVGGLGLLLLHSSPRPGVSQEPVANQSASFQKVILPFLKQHCHSCHGNGKKRGGLSLDQFTDEGSVQKGRQVWENVLHMLRSGEMPPPERPRPTPAEIERVTGAINRVLNSLDCTQQRNVGRVTLRRLNRNEYNNTIRDLVGVDFQPAQDFPADDTGYGFDNIGDVLSMSPLLLEKYLQAAETILDRAIVIVDPPKPSSTRLAGLRVSFGAGEIPKGRSPQLHGQGEVSTLSNVDEGEYIIRVEVAAQQVGSEPVRGMLRLGARDVKEFTVKGPTTIEYRTHLRAVTTRFAVGFLNPFTDPKITDREKQKRLLIVRGITLDGPHNAPPPRVPAVQQKLMAHTPGLAPRAAAAEIVGRFATRAFRRPVSPEEVERLLGLYDKSTKKGERFENSVKLALLRVLVSPHFLFRVELDPANAVAGKAYPITEHALASRLSYFFWSSMPDEELLQLANQGQLRTNLQAQVQRLIRDPKSVAFVQNFAGQWLTLRSLDNVNPDPKVFPEFDRDLRQAMLRETELFFEAILREERSILEFLDADFSFLNERLAQHYGIAGVKGQDFQRVKLPATRGGILTHGSILTLTSYPTRTSPVQRGKWVLEQLLNTPPPPPPPDVPQLETAKQLQGSLRQVMEQHRTNKVCASCHQRMDPIGFGFENFDAIGRWREKDGKFDIDPSGVLPDGKTFKGPAELKAILRSKKELFARCLTEKVLTYALGRGVEYYDRCAVDDILKALAKNNYRFSTLLLEVVSSEPFQMRTAVGKK